MIILTTATDTETEEFKRRLARVFHENGVFRRLTDNHPALPSPDTRTVDSGGPSWKTHRKRKSLTKTEKPTPLSTISNDPSPESSKEESTMTTYITYGAARLRPFSGRTKDYQGIVDFLESIETQAAAECRDDESGREKLQLRLFRTNLRGDAKNMLNMLTQTEREDWRQVKAIYIRKYKTERDQRAKQKAREAVASFKQRSDESLRAYGERAVKLRQLLEATDEGFLVSRFMRGVKDKAIRQMLAIGQEDLSKVTVGQLNQKIRNLTGTGDDSHTDEETEESEAESGESSSDEDEYKRHKRKSKKKSDGKALKRAQRAIAEMEEKIKVLTTAANKSDSFTVQQAPSAPTYQARNNSNGQNYGSTGTPYTCYSCGMAGHMARFCPDKTQGRVTRNGAGATVLFPGDNGPQRMIWVDYPPKGLAPGYYPIEPLPQGENRHRTPPNRFQANNAKENVEPASAGKITELKEVTYVDIVSSAAENMSIGRDVVRYVNAVEDVFVTGRRRRADTDAGSSDAPPRQKGRVEEPVNAAPAGTSRVAPQPISTDSESEGETPERGLPAEPIAASSPTRRRRVTVEQAEDQDMEEVVQLRAAPATATLPKKTGEPKTKRGLPKGPRPIRMMIGRPGFDVVAEFRDLPVTNLRWGTLMDMAPALRRQIGTGLLLERRERKAKPKPAETMEVNAMVAKPEWKVPCVNFFTKAILKVSNRQFEIDKVMIDPGSVVNLASIEVLERIGAPLSPVHDLTIRTATSALTRIRYCSDVDTIVAGVKVRIRIYAMPREFALSYGLLLSRRWLRKVRARGNYEKDTYIISDEAGLFRPVNRYLERAVNAVEIPRIGRDQSSDSSGLEEDVKADMELVEASGDSEEDIIREVIGEATRAMKEQSEFGAMESDDSYDEASSSSEDESWNSGNAGGF